MVAPEKGQGRSRERLADAPRHHKSISSVKKLPAASLPQSPDGEARLSVLLERSSQPFAIGFPDGRIGSVNDAVLDLIGYTRDEFASIDWIKDLTPPEWVPLEQAKLEELQRTGRPVRYEKEYVRKDGSRVPIEVFVHLVRDKKRRPAYYYAFITDITERRKMQADLKDSETRYRDLVEMSPNGIAVHQDGKIVFCNPAGLRLLGAPGPEALVGRPITKIVHPDYLARALDRIRRMLGGETGLYPTRDRYLRLDGTAVDVEAMAAPVLFNGRPAVQVVVRDIGEQMKAEEALRKAARAMRVLSAGTDAVARETDETALLQRVCRIIVEIGYRMAWVGYAEDDEARTVRPVAQAGADAGYPGSVRVSWGDSERGLGPTGTAIRTGKLSVSQNIPSDPAFSPWRDEAVKRGYRSSLAIPLISDGRAFGALNIYAAETEAFHEEEARLLGELADNLAFGILAIRDKERRALSEAAFRTSEEKYRRNFENVLDVIYAIDLEARVIDISPSVERLVGYKPEEIVGRFIRELDFIAPGSEKQALSDTARVLAGERIDRAVYEFVTKDGRRIFGEVSGTPIFRDGAIVGAISVARDVTERLAAEELLRQSETRYRTLFELIPDAVAVTGPDITLVNVNQATLRLLGVGAAADLIGRGAMDVIVPEDRDAASRGFQEFLRAEKPGVMEFRMSRRGAPVPVEGSASVFRNARGGIESIILVARDISERKRNEVEIQKHIAKLEQTLRETISVLSAATEIRDPYTAGHQRRVTDLAVAIAREMGLSKDRIDGISLGGVVHDVGKIYVPSEILSKPGRLSSIEFTMIQTHAQAGYDILKQVDFPWPIAEMVYQHHERLDGSGYPRGLTGENILLEARIIAVADVVEAMASHRPYRPSVGIDRALLEIIRGRGTLFEPEAVDCCVRLIREKGFRFD